MKVRRDPLLVSSILFTLALLIPMPRMLWLVWVQAETRSESRFVTLRTANDFAVAVGLACISNIAIGLIATWTGYIKGARWAWFVMFVILSLWAIPVFLLPHLSNLKDAVPITQWVPDAIRESGLGRDLLGPLLIIPLMTLGLVLPVKKFFLRRGDGHLSDVDRNRTSPI